MLNSTLSSINCKFSIVIVTARRVTIANTPVIANKNITDDAASKVNITASGAIAANNAIDGAIRAINAGISGIIAVDVI